jgi:hypothetical protein
MSNNEELDERGPLEQAYDSDIRPLMRDVRRLCNVHGIRMVAGFDLDLRPESEDANDRLLATHTTVVSTADLDLVSSRLRAAVVVLKDLGPSTTMAFTLITSS